MSPPDLAIASGRCKASVFGEGENALEGFARGLSIVTDLSANVSYDFSQLRSTGGGSRGDLEMWLRAALSDCRLHTFATPEALFVGAALPAGDPAAQLAAACAPQMDLRRELYPALAALWPMPLP
jgi:sugar (pentulose or hexulose) kinase